MAAVLVSAFGITGELDKVGFFRDNIFELLCLKSTVHACHSVMLYHQLVLSPIMCAKDASFLCPSAGYVHPLLPCAKFPWVQKYFEVGRYDGLPCLQSLPAPRSCLRPRPQP